MIEKKGRMAFIITLFLVIATLFCFRLMNLQLINGESYAQESQNKVITKTTVKAARGEILDRYCRPIVQNETVYTVEFNTTLIEDINRTVLETIRVFEKCGQAYIDTFPIIGEGPYNFTEDFLTKRSSDKDSDKAAVTAFDNYLKPKKTEAAASPNDIIAALVKYYKLNGYTPEEVRKIIAVRYEMEQRTEKSFFTFAEDINIQTATTIKENSDILKGVYLETEPLREYTHEYFASHIIGTVGRINAKEYETLQEQGYGYNDNVGKDGIEKACESYLRGIDGYKYAVRDKTGSTTEVIENQNKQPQKGNDVILTLDMNMQMIAEKALPEVMAQLQELHGETAATSGAAVFMEVETGELLVSASYPTYNLATYNQDFNDLSKSETTPYLNRVIAGTFPPGSTFKMVTAVAALEEGVLTPSTTFTCHGKYTYYDDYQPTCFNGKSHGTVDVRNALKKSCNIFFFDAGRRLGIDTLSSYGSMLGFGQKTGIELPGEAKGMIASRQYRLNKGQTWEEGETLLAAIGQTDNAATPLQLCNYVATIARGGTRLEPHIIKSVRNSETGDIIMETVPVVSEEMDLSEKTKQTVLEGMEMVTQSGGSLYSSFKDFKMATIAGKTGTAEKDNQLPTSLIVGLAPAENPKIAFAVVVEQGGASSSQALSSLIKDVLSYYFSSIDSQDTVSESGELLP